MFFIISMETQWLENHPKVSKSKIELAKLISDFKMIFQPLMKKKFFLRFFFAVFIIKSSQELKTLLLNQRFTNHFKDRKKL